MSNASFDEQLIREHAPEPLEGHTVVVMERAGEAGETIHSLLESGAPPSSRPGLAALLRTPGSYFAFAVDTSRAHRLTFAERVTLANRRDPLDLQVSLWYRVADARRLVMTRNGDPLRRLRERVADAVVRETVDLPLAEAHAFDTALESVVTRTLPGLKEFAHDYGIALLELRLWVNLPDSDLEPAETERLEHEVRETARILREQQNAQLERVSRDERDRMAEMLNGIQEKVRYRLDEPSSDADGHADRVRVPRESAEVTSRGEPTGSSASSGGSSAPPPGLAAEDVLYRVWYATNRQPEEDASRVSYGARMDERVHLGSCDVVIPAAHRMGELGSPWIRRFLTRTDDRLRLSAVTPLEDEAFWRGVRDVAASFPADQRHALVFLHGYRVSFEDAALRAAQLGHDLGVRGPVAFFSWPSRATVFGYPADGAAVEASEDEITDFLIQFAQGCGAERVHVIAHSMGNRPLLRALQRIVAAGESVPAVRFGHLVLAAPDVTRELFLDVADQYRRLAQRTTLYVSNEDNALRAAFRLQGPRVGLAPPVTCAEGIDTIQLDKVDRTLLGHSTFAEARPVLTDIRILLTSNASPGDRGLDERQQGNDRYWEFRR
ncbi:MAG TPA: alpha/beta hydrolase [Longimicrobium sp.]|nr:alpha/beta hydrolase [Longimicrobium sp.]